VPGYASSVIDSLAHLRQPRRDVQAVTALDQRHMTEAVSDCERRAHSVTWRHAARAGQDRRILVGSRTDISSAMFVARPDLEVKLRTSENSLHRLTWHQDARCLDLTATGLHRFARTMSRLVAEAHLYGMRPENRSGARRLCRHSLPVLYAFQQVPCTACHHAPSAEGRSCPKCAARHNLPGHGVLAHPLGRIA